MSRRAASTALTIFTGSLTALLLLSIPAFASDDFTPACSVPFGDLAQKTPFDSQCSIDGSPQANPAAHAQNRAKNEFCAAGPAIPLTFDSFSTLQSTIDGMGISYGGAAVLRAPRSVLRNLRLSDGSRIGEGSVVQIVAFVQQAHYSDVSKGESVNCNIPGNDNNDIHVPLVQDPQDDPCDSVTAEIIPHFRPAEITPEVLNSTNRPMRFRGQLFFDASHHPCSANGRQSPPRTASWEIHPVYEIDVCKEPDIDDCAIGDDTKWTTLQDWVGLNEPNSQE